MKRLILLTIGVLIYVCSSNAQTAVLPWKVVGSGGALGATGGGNVLSATIGQPLIGLRAVTDGNKLSQGFWLQIPIETSVDEYEDEVVNASDVSNYPNPFTSSTSIRFTFPLDGRVSIRMYDLVGNLVRVIEADLSIAGAQEVLFDGLDNYGAPLGSGTYLYEVTGTTAEGKPFRRTQRLGIVR